MKKIKGSLALVLIAVITFSGAAFISFYLMPKFYESKKETIMIPMLIKEKDIGEKIDEKNIKMVEIGKYNLPKDVVKTIEEIKNKYVSSLSIKADRYVYKDQLSQEEPKTALKYKINDGGLAVPTDLAKAVGGLIKAGDIVEAHIVERDENSQKMIATLHDELRKLKVLKILNANGISTEAVDENYKGYEKPDFVVFDTLTDIQKKLLIEGAYNGEIHLSLLNPDNLENYKQKADMKKAPEVKKDEDKIEKEKESSNNPQTDTKEEGGFEIQ